MSSFGKIEAFDAASMNWTEYQERIQLYFEASDVPTAKRKAAFLSCCGAKTYSLLKGLVAPKKPSEEELDRILTLLTNHFAPKPSEVVARFKFNTRIRTPDESVSDFIACLKKLADDCEFGALRDSLLRDRVVCGISNSEIQRRLLESAELSLAQAENIAIAMEVAKKDSSMLSGTNGGNSMDAEANEATANFVAARKKLSCYRCGGSHLARVCRHEKSVCNFCKKIGHIARVCLSKKEAASTDVDKGRRKKRKPQQVNKLDDSEHESEDDDTDIYDMWCASASSSRNPFVAEVQIDGTPLKMELDTGASVSLISAAVFERTFPELHLKPSPVLLRSYSGHLSSVMGEVQVDVKYKDRECVLPLFVMKEDTPTLLGRNWMEGLRITPFQVQAISSRQSLDGVLQGFPEVFSDQLGAFKGASATIAVEAGAKPRFFKPRLVPFALQDRVSEEIQRLVREGIVEPVRSAEWAAPIVPVVKTDGRIRICGDFKVTINPVISMDKYPVPRVEELFAKMSGGVKFTKLDLKDAYQQIELDKESRKYVTINTQKGLYQYTRLPFGVSTAPAIFQREMENLLRDLKHVVVYLDDILVTGTDEEDHLRNLTLVLERLKTAGLRLRRGKCKFMQEEVEYLGHVISKKGLEPSAHKVDAVLKAPQPRNVKELQSYLGLLNFYRKFLPNLSTVLQPLHALLSSTAKWSWTDNEEQAFQKSKELLTSATVLVHYDPAKPVVLACDASPHGLGAVLAHRDEDGQEKPIAFASRILSAAETNYSQLDKEALALVFGVTKFYQYLWGRPFEAVTDHKPLLGLLGQDRPVPTLASPRLVRWALLLSPYQYKLVYRAGKSIGHADALSRLPLPTSNFPVERPGEVFMLSGVYPSVLSPAVVARATRNDPVLSRVLEALWTASTLPVGPEWEPFAKRSNELSVQEDCVLWGNRLVVPASLQASVLGILHESHPGISKMKSVARSHVWWETIDADITSKVRGCKLCQQQQRSAPQAEMTPWPFPEKPWSRLHADFGGPFKGHYFFVLVDALSKWIEVFPVASPSAAATIECLRTAFATHGLPDTIVSDNGAAFTSDEFRNFLNRNGVRRILIPPYHPASNGAAERVVQVVKRNLKKTTTGDFKTQLARMLFVYRNTPHEVTGRTPAELLFGRKLRTSLDMLRPSLRSNVLFRQLKQKMYHDRGKKQLREQPGHVYTRNFREGPSWVPATVVAPRSASSMDVQTRDGSVWHRHHDHIRPRTPSPEVVALSPPAEYTTPHLKDLLPEPGNSGSAPPDERSPRAAASTSKTVEEAGVSAPVPPTTPPSPLQQLRRSSRVKKPVIRYGL